MEAKILSRSGSSFFIIEASPNRPERGGMRAGGGVGDPGHDDDDDNYDDDGCCWLVGGGGERRARGLGCRRGREEEDGTASHWWSGARCRSLSSSLHPELTTAQRLPSPRAHPHRRGHTYH